MPEPELPPYSPGEIVLINGFTHLGYQRVDACEWSTLPGRDTPCWICECSDSPPPGAAPGAAPAAGGGGAKWRGPAAYLSRLTL